MSLIGITSDIHGSKIAWDKLFYSPISERIILWVITGDVLYHGPKNPIPEGYSPLELASAINEYKKPLIIVKGNCDSEVDQTLIKVPIMSPYGVLFIDNLKILIYHGDKNLDNWIFSLEDDDRFNIVISGHTHIPLLQKRNGVIFLNPGSPSIPLGEVKEKTFALLDTSKRSIEILNLEGKIVDSLIF